MAEPTFVNVGNDPGAAGQDAIIDVDAFANGDLIVALVFQAGTAAFGGTFPPTGWTLKKNDTGAGSRCCVIARVKQAGDTDATVQIDGVLNSAASWVAYRGVPANAATLLEVSGGAIASSGTDLPFNAVTMDDPESVSLLMIAYGSSSTSVIWGGNYAERLDIANVAIADDLTVDAGSLDPPDGTLAASRANRFAYHIEVPGVVARSGVAATSGGGTFASTGEKKGLSTLSESGSGSVSTAGSKGGVSLVTASGGGSSGELGSKGGQGAFVISGEGTASNSGQADKQGNLDISGGGFFETVGVAEEGESPQEAITVSGDGVITVNGQKGSASSMSTSAGGGVSTVGTAGRLGVVSVSGEGSVSILGLRSGAGAATFSGSGSFNTSGDGQVAVQILVSGGGSVTMDGHRLWSGGSAGQPTRKFAGIASKGRAGEPV